VYRCPAGQSLIWRFTTIEHGQSLHCCWSSACKSCPLKAQCTPAPQRRVKRWEHEAVLEAMQQRMDRAPDMMQVRRQTVEHPFGTLKAWMGSTHFLMRTLQHVSTEMSLYVLAYNLKRVMRIIGIAPLMQAIRVWQQKRRKLPSSRAVRMAACWSSDSRSETGHLPEGVLGWLWVH